jgi:hypothetical protein
MRSQGLCRTEDQGLCLKIDETIDRMDALFLSGRFSCPFLYPKHPFEVCIAYVKTSQGSWGSYKGRSGIRYRDLSASNAHDWRSDFEIQGRQVQKNC